MGDGVPFAKKGGRLACNRLFLTHLPDCGHRLPLPKVIPAGEFCRFGDRGLGILGCSG